MIPLALTSPQFIIRQSIVYRSVPIISLSFVCYRLELLLHAYTHMRPSNTQNDPHRRLLYSTHAIMRLFMRWIAAQHS